MDKNWDKQDIAYPAPKPSTQDTTFGAIAASLLGSITRF